MWCCCCWTLVGTDIFPHSLSFWDLQSSLYLTHRHHHHEPRRLPIEPNWNPFPFLGILSFGNFISFSAKLKTISLQRVSLFGRKFLFVIRDKFRKISLLCLSYGAINAILPSRQDKVSRFGSWAFHTTVADRSMIDSTGRPLNNLSYKFPVCAPKTPNTEKCEKSTLIKKD